MPTSRRRRSWQRRWPGGCSRRPPRWRTPSAARSPASATTGRDDAVRRVFQALRIAVNDEFAALDALLRHLPSCLNPGGVVAILTFHSGEDRRVKQAFKSGLRDGTYDAIADDVLRPSPAECRANPRAKAAKLRWASRHSEE